MVATNIVALGAFLRKLILKTFIHRNVAMKNIRAPFGIKMTCIVVG